MENVLNFVSCRPCGVEIELNSFDGLEMAPLGRQPDGIHYIGNLISKTLGQYVEIREYGYTSWYSSSGYWVLKPDNSCGIEACSPVVQGWNDLLNLCRVIDAFQKDSHINANTNCSFHLHVNLQDLTDLEVCNILKWWIKCEPVFFDSISDDRKNNKYCQFIGLWDWLENDIENSKLFEILGIGKYYSVNIYHLYYGERHTMEFRLGENSLCRNSFFAKNWVKLLLYFLEIAKSKTVDNLNWLDVKEVFDFLGFFQNNLSPGLIQTRDWFLGRLYYNSSSCLNGFFNEARIVTKKQIGELLKSFPDFNLKESLYPADFEKAVYSKIYAT